MELGFPRRMSDSDIWRAAGARVRSGRTSMLNLEMFNQPALEIMFQGSMFNVWLTGIT